MYRDGRAATLPVLPSPSIFDATVGTGRRTNRPAIVYARCAEPGHTAVTDALATCPRARVTSTSLTRAPVLTGRYRAQATPRLRD